MPERNSERERERERDKGGVREREREYDNKKAGAHFEKRFTVSALSLFHSNFDGAQKLFENCLRKASNDC